MGSNIISPGIKKLSKRYLIITFLRNIRSLITIVIGILIAVYVIMKNEALAFIDEHHIIIGVVIIIIIIAVALFNIIFSYLFFEFELKENEIYLKKGIFWKSRFHIPYDRIHSVNMNARILDRIFGVVAISFDTPGGEIGDEDDLLIPAVPKKDAYKLKHEIFQRKSIDTEQGDDSGIKSETGKLKYNLTFKELILFSLTNTRAIAIAFAVAVFINNIAENLNIFTVDISASIDKTVEYLLSLGLPIIGGIIIAVLLLSFIISFIIKAVAYANFSVTRNEMRIEISKGLIEQKLYSIQIDRIQTVEIKQNTIARIMGFAQISVTRASTSVDSADDEEGEGFVVTHPFIKKDKIEDFFKDILPEFTDIPVNLEPLGKPAKKKAVLRSLILVTILIALIVGFASIDSIREFIANETFLFRYVIIIPLIIILFMVVIGGWVGWKGKKYKQSTKYLAIKKGWVSPKITYISKKKIQRAHVSQSPFQKRYGLFTITAYHAGGGATELSLDDLSDNAATEYLTWMSE